MKWKLDIENKILIPFMILIVMPLIIVGIVSYWNSYQLMLNESLKNHQDVLKSAVAYLEILDKDVENGMLTLEEGKSKAIAYFKNVSPENMAIVDDGEYVINSTGFDILAQLKGTDLYTTQKTENDNYVYTLESFENWNWTIILATDKSILSEDLVGVQKYTVLLIIIFLVLSMQAIIFIAHHISRPIKYFAEVCRKIEKGHLNERVDINRGDEIGVLANSFNNMIDHLKESTEKLLEMTRFNEDILKNIYTGIITTDNNGNIVTINEWGENVIKKYRDVDITDRLKVQISETIRNTKNINTVTEIQYSSGKSIYFDVSTSLLKKDNNSIYGAICSFNDITERKILETSIVKVDRLASVGQFAAGLAHEIRNPLTGIKTTMQVIKNRKLKSDDPSGSELLEGVIYEIDRINSLVTNLLDFSKPENAYCEVADVVEILKRSLALAREGVERKNIQVDLEVGPEDMLAFIDVRHGEQIFINIINNAIDAMDLQGHLKIKVGIIARNNLPYVETTIEDNGIGMDKETKDRIFEAFFTTKAKGTGLGMLVAAKLVEENRGHIELESELNMGSKFSIIFPLFRGGENNEN